MELPFFSKYSPPEAHLLVATVFTQGKCKKISEVFFGNLLSRLERENCKVIVIGKVTHQFRQSIEDNARKELGSNVYCPSHLLTKWDGLKCLLSAIYSFLKYRYPKEYRVQLFKDMAQSHMSEVLSALLYQSMIKKISFQNPQLRILHPFEGNTWESACSLSGQYDVGFQHSSVLNDQIKITSFPGRPLPSKVITTGREATEQLVRDWGYNPDVLIDGYTLRQAKIFDVQPKIAAPSKVRRVLVLMQGNEHQNGVLDILREFISKNSGVSVFLRPHPAVPYEGMGLREDEMSKVSNNPDLYSDILNHDACIYVSSTAALESTYLGVPVVHIVLGKDVDGDPLFHMPYLKRVAKTSDDIAIILKELEKYPLFDEELVLARDYFDRYFKRPDEFMEEQFKEWLCL